jgi:ABC-2 type transport system permease protein
MRTKTLIHGLKNSQKIRAMLNGVGIYMTVGEIASKFATSAHCIAVWTVMAVAPGVNVPVKDPLLVLYFGTMGAILLALLGIFTGVWADKFDHAAAATNFVIQPLTLLSGTFYAVERLGPTVAGIAHANPFFHVIDGFRAGFIGVSDGPLGQSALLLALVNVALWFLCYRVVKSGWKLRA